MIEATLVYQSPALTTGIGFGLNGPATPTVVCYEWRTFTALSTTFMTYSTRFGHIKPVTTAVQFINSNVLASMNGLIRNGTTAGSATLIFRSEVGGSLVTIKAGSFLRYRKLT